MTCARCEQFEEEIAYLKSELGLQRDGEALARIRSELHITPQAAALLFRLYAAKGRLVSRAQLEDAVPAVWADEDERRPHWGSVYVCRLRAALGADAIATLWGQGYRLTPAGLATVKAILEPEARSA